MKMKREMHIIMNPIFKKYVNNMIIVLFKLFPYIIIICYPNYVVINITCASLNMYANQPHGACYPLEVLGLSVSLFEYLEK